MALESNNATILCKVFSTTLTGQTLIWFRQFSEKLINNFETFCTLLMKKYGNHRRQEKTMRDLHWMKQKDDETSQEYLDQFLGVMN